MTAAPHDGGRDGADDSTVDRDELLGRFVEGLGERGADADDLLRRLDLDEQDAAHGLAGVEALRLCLGEDLDGEPTLPPPDLPDDYELKDEIGRGGMGVVYRAHQRSLDRDIAVKVLRPGELIFGEALRRFEREARSLAKLRHPHIVSVHEIGRSGGHLYYTMDLVEGESLEQELKRGPLTPSRAVRLMRQVASAIAYTHGHGLIHRDLKPGNVLVDGSGEALVADFGLVRDVEDGGGTQTGHVMGTPDYMSPEQARGDSARIGEATDIYALGVLLYESLTGRKPFANRPLHDKIQAILHEEPPAPRRLNPSVPVDLERICQMAMAKEPERRYPTARALLEDLERFEEGKPVRAQPPSFWYRTRRLVRRHKAVTALSAVLVAMIVLIPTVVMPWMEGSPSARMAAAERLLRSGEPGGAANLAWDVMSTRRHHPPNDPMKQQAARCFVEAKVRRARQLARDGKILKAVELLRLVQQQVARNPTVTLGHELHMKLLGRRARLLGEAGEYEQALEILDEMKAAVAEDAPDPKHGLRSYHAYGALIRSPWRPRDPLVTDHSDHLALFLAWDEGDEELALRWLRHCDQGTTAMVPELLPVLDELHPNELQMLSEWLGNGVQPELTDAEIDRWIDLVEGPALSEPSRAFVGRHFAEALDIPHDATFPTKDVVDTGLGVGFADSEPPSMSMPSLDHLLGTARSLRGKTRVEAGRERVVRAIEMRRDVPEAFAERIDRWLAGHTGAAADTDWDTWLRVHEHQTQVEWLAKALGLDAASVTEEALYARYLNASGLDRERLHHLMALRVPDNHERTAGPFADEPILSIRPPVWPATRSEPDDLSRAWKHTLDAPSMTSLHTWAFLTRRGGYPPKRLGAISHEAQANVVSDSRMEYFFRFNPHSRTEYLSRFNPPRHLRLGIAPLGAPGSRLRFGWSSADATAANTLSDDLLQRLPLTFGTAVAHMKVHLGAGEEGLVLKGTSEIRLPGPLTTPLRYQQWPLGEVRPIYVPPEWDAGPRAPGSELIFVAGLSLPAPTPIDPVERLAEAFRSRVEFISRHGEEGIAAFHFDGTRRLLEAAAWIPLPQVRDEIAWLDGQRRRVFTALEGETQLETFLTGEISIPSEPLHPLELASLGLPARLLAGDATALDEDGFDARLDRALGALGLGGDFWARVLVHTSAPRLRALATERLLVGPTATATWAGLPGAAEEAGVELPSAIAAKTRPAVEWMQRRGLWIAVLAVALPVSLVLGSLLCAMLALVQRKTARRRDAWLALLAGLGIAFASLTLDANGFDYMPADVGWGITAIALLLLAVCRRSPLFALTTVLFATAALLLTYARFSGQPAGLAWNVASVAALLLALTVVCQRGVAWPLRLLVAAAGLVYAYPVIRTLGAIAFRMMQGGGVADAARWFQMPSEQRMVFDLLAAGSLVVVLVAFVLAMRGRREAAAGQPL